jgi:hypothetical protein
MGLDMYLDARLYLREWDDNDKVMREAVNAAVPDRGDLTIKTVTAEGIYWRKANQIHKWFVDNVQEGNDDCGTYYVSREKLEELRNVCQQVIDDPDLAEGLLPTEDGFFFGSTEYGQYYMEDLEYTVEQIDKLLDPKYERWDFSYHSSW